MLVNFLPHLGTHSEASAGVVVLWGNGAAELVPGSVLEPPACSSAKLAFLAFLCSL